MDPRDKPDDDALTVWIHPLRRHCRTCSGNLWGGTCGLSQNDSAPLRGVSKHRNFEAYALDHREMGYIGPISAIYS
ncbi:MAG: hypothetical protein KUG59_03375, partial [Parvibaculaceae bacterium]|nr:hypothetical protein [Parvibaculaceae bacterium]